MVSAASPKATPKPASKAKARPKKKKAEIWAHQDTIRRVEADSASYKRQMAGLHRMTKTVGEYLREKEELKKRQDLQLPSEGQQLQPQLELLEHDRFDPAGVSLHTAAIELPQTVVERIGVAVKYLVTKDHQNWPIVLDQIQANGGLKGIPEVDIRKLVYRIPRRQLFIVFPKIEAMLAGAGIQKSPKIMNAYCKSIIAGPKPSETHLKLLEACVEEIRAVSKKGKLPRETYEILIEAYGKQCDIKKMDATISEMKLHNLQPLANVYSNVLTTCVYKTKDHKQAVQIFDSMKFLAGSLAPGTSEYQDVIVSYVNNDDIEKALDLYQEMLASSIAINQNIVVALARGCMARDLLRFKAWDFMFEIYRMNWEPTVPTLEYMLYLAAKDGDLALARALFQQLNLLHALSARSFGFLMLAYARSGLAATEAQYKVPAISLHEEGRNFRLNLLDKIDHVPTFEDPTRAIPFLPKPSLSSKQELLGESSAVMAHALLVNPGFVNTESVNSFLNVAANAGRLEDFVDRYNEFTELDAVPETKTSTSDPKAVVLEPPEAGELTEEVSEVELNESSEEVNAQLSELNGEPKATESQNFELEEVQPDESTLQTLQRAQKSPILAQISSHNALKKIPRDLVTYVIALKAAARHKNYSFSQEVWQERGKYRKSTAFRNLPQQKRQALDFQFATAMVNCLTEMKLLDDALAVVVSTEYQFRWTWRELSALHKAAVSVGLDKTTRVVRNIARRAQIEFEGKIRRKDYKKYVMERGF